jgi:AraC-like DNA-binding protein
MNNFQKYLNVGPLEKQWGFHVTTAGYAKINPMQRYPNNTEHPDDHYFTWNRGRILNGYYLVFISKGQGVFESTHTQPQKIKAGTCFFLFPGVWHRYKPDKNSGWEEYWVGFRGRYSEDLMSKGFFLPEKPIVAVGFNKSLLSLFNKLIETIIECKTGYHQVAAGITLQILGLIHGISTSEEQITDPTHKLISKAQFILQNSLEDPVQMELLAKDLAMSYSKFRKAFKEITGESPNQYHLNLRLQKAKELLINTSLSINEIAMETGFDSLFYFSKLFKKKTGKSPKSFRNQERRNLYDNNI